MPRPRARAASAVAVVLLALASAAVPAAGAPSDAGSARLTLVAQDPWTAVGGDVTLRVAATGAPADAGVTVTAFQAVTSRKGYEAAMAGSNA